jgi:hypothetical protein
MLRLLTVSPVLALLLQGSLIARPLLATANMGPLLATASLPLWLSPLSPLVSPESRRIATMLALQLPIVQFLTQIPMTS